METKIEVVISSPDEHKIFPEAGETEEDWKGKEKELKEFRKEYSEEVHNFLVKRLKNYVSEPEGLEDDFFCLLYTSPSPRDRTRSRMPSSA